MTDHQTEFKDSKLFYKKTGAGPKVLLTFHGFGQDHRAFDLLAQELFNDYTFYSFDLYFHGKSEWGYNEQPLEKNFWIEVIKTFLTENEIEKFSIAGFSLGCRFEMTIVEELYPKTERIFLLAPDGIKSSFWFTISTYPILLRKIFKSMIAHPGRFKVIVNTLHELKCMDKGLLKFVEHQMNTLEKRKRVYYSWVVFRHLRVDIKKIAQLVNDKKIPVTIIVGKLDHVIPPSSLKNFTKLLQHGSFEVLDTGHAGLLKDTSLAALLKP